MQSEYEQLGLAFDVGATRVGRPAEALVIVKAMLEGEPVSFAGRHYRVTGQTIHPRPVQRPRPPIFIGGNAPRLLQVAAREADIVGLTGIAFRRGGAKPDVSDFRAAIVDERVRFVRDMAGGRVELNALVQRVIVTDDRHRAARALATQWPPLTAEDILESPYVLVGTPEEMADDLRGRRERWGISYVMTHEAFMDALAPVVDRLAGR
jgi:probable F420-dependent oxidoreductase